MSSNSRAESGHSKPPRGLLPLAVCLFVSLLAVGPAAAQDSGSTDPSGGEDSPTGTQEEEGGGSPGQSPGPSTGGSSGSSSGNGQGSGPTAGEDQPPIDAPSEPVILEVVDDDANTIQIIEYSDGNLPSVRLVVAVPPALAGDLTESSFAMTENGQVRSLSVAKLEDVIEVVVVIDTSGSMGGDPIESAKLAAKDFVASLDDETRLAIVGFGSNAATKATFDSTRAETTAAIDDLAAAGETTLYDAFVVAANEFGDNESRKFVVVLSDGTDTASTATLDEAAQALLDQGINLYAITLVSPDADFAGLETLSAQVGGQVVAASDDASLSATYSEIASRLTNQYRIDYESFATGQADIVVSVDANGILAVARQTLPIGSAPVATGSGVETSTDQATAVNPVELGTIDTTNPAITVQATDESLLGSRDAAYAGAAGLFLGLLVALFVAFSTEPRGPSAFERLNFKPTSSSPRNGLASIADRASSFADRLLEKREKRGALDAALEAAGMDMRPGEYLMAAAGAALGLAAVGFVLLGPVAGGIFLGLGVVGGRIYVNMKANRRKKMFGKQLGDTLIMIAGSLRAGHGVVEAIDTVASQADSPTGDEFTRAVAEARIGRDMVESLYDIAARTESEDFVWVVRAIAINRELGGDLAEILDNVGDTIRDRNRLRDQVKALSAEGKVSAMILFALPVLVGGWVRTSNPEYLASMTDETAGKGVLAFAVFALLMGGLWLKKLVNVEF